MSNSYPRPKRIRHIDLQGITKDDHHSSSNDHAQSHTHASHTSIGADDHHPQSHTHASHTAIGTDDHHPQTHTHVGLATIAVRTTDGTPVNNSTVLVNDTVLKIALLASEIWTFTAYIRFVSNSTADIQLAFTVPAAATLLWQVTEQTAAGGGAVAQTEVTSSGTAVIVQNDFDTLAVLAGIVVNGANAGDLQLQMAQNTATVVDTKILAGSCIVAHKLA